MAGSGYGAKTTGITGNTTGMSDNLLKVATTGAVAVGHGAKTITVGVSDSTKGEDFECVDTSKLTNLTGTLKESDYKCASPSGEGFRAKVQHGPKPQ